MNRSTIFNHSQQRAFPGVATAIAQRQNTSRVPAVTNTDAAFMQRNDRSYDATSTPNLSHVPKRSPQTTSNTLPSIQSQNSIDRTPDEVLARFEACAEAIDRLTASLQQAMETWRTSGIYEPDSVKALCSRLWNKVYLMPRHDCRYKDKETFCHHVFPHK